MFRVQSEQNVFMSPSIPTLFMPVFWCVTLKQQGCNLYVCTFVCMYICMYVFIQLPFLFVRLCCNFNEF